MLTPGESCVRTTELLNPLDILCALRQRQEPIAAYHSMNTYFQSGVTGSLSTISIHIMSFEQKVTYQRYFRLGEGGSWYWPQTWLRM